MTRQPGRAALIAASIIGLIAVAGVSAHADPVADFYRGKQLTLVIGTSPGNDYDFRGRLLARYMGRHIPGEPVIVPQNMPGAGGIKAANWLATIAPRDGTARHMIMTNMMAAQAIGTHGIQFDTRKFSWVGNTTSTPNVTNAWYTSGITSAMTGEESQAVADSIVNTPPEIIARAKVVLGDLLK
jgi:tripartite-type tricarboxylate transporter receptor subunit TctC